MQGAKERMAKKPYKKPQISREQLEQELLAANTALWQANQKLKTEEKNRQELLSNLSHDLRAPLTALSGTVELLKSKTGMEPQEYQELLKVMERRIQTIQVMMNDLFLLTRIESPDTKLELVPMEAGIFLEEYFYSCEADRKYEKRKLILEVPEEFPCQIWIDVPQMIRVLDNLFTNALRYSKDGGEIRLRAERHGGVPSAVGQGNDLPKRAEKKREVWISVCDNGIGIGKEDLPHIFERAYRASRSRTPGDGGSGLGLAIAKSIVERHGGRIWCESELGKGSSFVVALPEI